MQLFPSWLFLPIVLVVSVDPLTITQGVKIHQARKEVSMTTDEWIGVGFALVGLALVALTDNGSEDDDDDDDFPSSYPPWEDAMNHRLPGSYESSPRR